MKTKKPTAVPSLKILSTALRQLEEAGRAVLGTRKLELTASEWVRYWRQFDESGATVQAQHEAMITEFANARGWKPACTWHSDRRIDTFTIPRVGRTAAVVVHVRKGHKVPPGGERLPYSWHDPVGCDAILVRTPHGASGGAEGLV